MGSFIYGLAVVLLIFEGIIIQCEGGGGAGGKPQSGAVTFENSILKIGRCNSGNSYEFIGPASHSRFGNLEELTKFLENSGDQVKKIDINVLATHFEPRIPNVIKDKVKNLEEVRIECYHDDKNFWEAFYNGKDGSSSFQKVQNFSMHGSINREKFNLHSIFPELKYLLLNANVVDKNCLDNVMNLKELTLKTTSIPEEKLESIFQKNNGLTMLELREPKLWKTMQSIAERLKDLKTLKVLWPGESFLLHADHGPKCVLPKVENFHIFFCKTHELYEIDKLSFHMPELQELTLDGDFKDDHFVKFIEHFKRLKIVNLFGNVDDLLNNMKRKWNLLESEYDGAFGHTYLKFSRK